MFQFFLGLWNLALAAQGDGHHDDLSPLIDHPIVDHPVVENSGANLPHADAPRFGSWEQSSYSGCWYERAPDGSYTGNWNR